MIPGSEGQERSLGRSGELRTDEVMSYASVFCDTLDSEPQTCQPFAILDRALTISALCQCRPANGFWSGFAVGQREEIDFITSSGRVGF